MLFVNYKIGVNKDKLLTTLEAPDSVWEDKSTRIHVKRKEDRLKVKCERLDKGTRDNAFLEGTYFIGRVKEKGSGASVFGIILTAPIYHFFFVLLFAFFIYQCFSVGGFAPLPIVLVVFDVFMFKDEFKKQKTIKRYIFLALKKEYDEKS